MSEAGAAEDRAKKFMMDAARLAEELRAEQDSAQVMMMKVMHNSYLFQQK